MRETILRHPDIVRISIGRIPMGQNALRFNERVLAILRAGDVPDELAVQSFLLMLSVVNGFTMDETGYVEEPAEPAPPMDTRPRWSGGISAPSRRSSFRT